MTRQFPFPTIATLSGVPNRQPSGDPMAVTRTLRRFFDESDPDRHLGGGCTYLDGTTTVVLDTTDVGALGNPDKITLTIDAAPGD
jgi:hypothetical protein